MTFCGKLATIKPVGHGEKTFGQEKREKESESMEQYLPVMNEEYRRKYYGTGIFGRAHKNTVKVSVLAYLFFGVVLVGGG